jgi:antitoxin VapB
VNKKVLTKVFKSGNSLAVRIPRELAVAGESDEVELERVGNTLVIRPAGGRSLAALVDVFAGFPAGFMAEGRAPQDQRPRDWVGAGRRRR